MEIYICENCGNEHDGSYGSGRFCSKHCRMSHNAKKVKNRAVSHEKQRAPFGTWKCNRCNLVFETKAQLLSHNRTVHPIQKGSSWNKGLTKETDKRVAKAAEKTSNGYKDGRLHIWSEGLHLSEEHKLKTSASMKRFCQEHPDRVPYVLNHSSKESYPEQYFRVAFTVENFPAFVQDYYIDGYFLDFAFESSRQYIEIDGEQHYTDKNCVEHDKIRTEKLNKSGWKCVCRIRWSKFCKLTNDQKHKFITALKIKLK